MKFKLTMVLLLVITFTSGNWAQESPRWNNNPSMVIYPTGNYVDLPMNNPPYIPPVMIPKSIVTPQGMYLAFPNIIVLPNANQQTELYLAISRGTPTFMFGSSNRTSGANINSGSYITTNAGVSWFGQDFINNGNTNNQRGDPGPTIGSGNRVIFSHLTSTVNFGALLGIGAEWSTNFGQNFSATVNLVIDGNADKNLSGADDHPSSPFFGNFYTAWTSFSTAPANSRFSRTVDGGVTWSPQIIINTTPAGHNAQGHDVVARHDGRVVVTWTAGVTGAPFTEDFAGVAYSVNGGVSFTAIENAFDCNGSRSTSFNGWGIRTNGFPRIAVDKSGGARNGYLYIVVSQLNLAPAGSDADVVLHRSIDGGVTWGAGVRVNQDALNNGKVQFFPCVSVDEAGGVNVAYYDNRAFPSVGDSCSVYISRSLDGGVTFTDLEVADHHFRPKPTPGLGGGYMGDYIGIASGAGKVWAFWMDDKTPGTNFQAWAGYITSGPPPANDVVVGPFLSLPATFTAGQNHTIRARVVNAGTLGQTNLPIRFSVNGTLQTTNTIASLPPGAIDSSQFTWNPGTPGAYTLRIFSGAAVDENRLNDTVTTTVTVSPSGTTNICMPTFQCRNNINRVLCDLCTTRDTIIYTNPNAVSVTRVTVKIDTAIHTWTSDVTWTLRHLALSSTLCAARGGSGDNWIGTIFADSAATPISAGTPPFTGLFRPETVLNVMNGSNPQGLWILEYTDAVGGDSGLLKAWCISICYLGFVGGIQTVEIPNYYSLSQNYPNPFNPATQIKYTIPKAGNVVLKIYDVLGKEVKTLVNEKKEVGVYNIDFDASNLSSGIYFYRIESGDFTAVKKMMLVK